MNRHRTVTLTGSDAEPEPEPTFEIEDLTEQRGTTGRPSRWTLVVVAATVAIVGFGFVGHELDRPAQKAPTPVPTAEAAGRQASTGSTHSLTISAPSEGDVVDGPTIEMRADAIEPLGEVHVAAVVGVDELGSTDVDVTRAGPFAASVAIIEPSWPTRIELRITQGPGRTAGTLLATRSLLASFQATVGLLGVSDERTGSREVLSVAGWVPAGSSSLRADLTDPNGRGLATAQATVGAPQAWGGAVLASQPFRVRLAWTAVLPGTALRLVLSWQDPVTGGLDSASQTLTVPLPTHRTVP